MALRAGLGQIEATLLLLGCVRPLGAGRSAMPHGFPAHRARFATTRKASHQMPVGQPCLFPSPRDRKFAQFGNTAHAQLFHVKQTSSKKLSRPESRSGLMYDIDRVFEEDAY